MDLNFTKVGRKDLHVIGLLLIAFSLPFSTQVNSAAIIFILLVWLLDRDLLVKIKKVFSNKFIIILILYFAVCLLGMLYTSNQKAGIGYLTKSFSLLLFPIIFSSYDYSNKVLQKILLAFVLAVFCCITYSLVMVFYFHNALIEEFSLYNTYRELLIKPLTFHPTYFSIYILFSIFCIIYLVFINKWYKGFLGVVGLLLVFYFFAFSLLLSARMPLLSSFFCLFITAVFYSIKLKKYIFIFVALAVIVSMLYYLFNNPMFNQRILEIRETALKPPVGIYHNSINLRIGILTCTFQELRSQWLLGTGTGDMQDVLNKCYESNGYSDVLYKLSFNTHSAYFDAFLRLGVLGLFSLVLLFYYSFNRAIKTKDVLFLNFIVFIATACITESILNSQKGIVFFTLFNSLFIYHSHHKLSTIKIRNNADRI